MSIMVNMRIIFKQQKIYFTIFFKCFILFFVFLKEIYNLCLVTHDTIIKCDVEKYTYN